MNKHDQFQSAVDLLIDANRANRVELAHFAETMGSRDYALEFCTVQVMTGRRMGKTTYVKSRAKPGDLVIVGRKGLADGYPCAVMLPCEITPALVRILSERGYSGETEWFPKTVYIEEPYLCGNVYKMIGYLALDASQTFVVLGTPAP